MGQDQRENTARSEDRGEDPDPGKKGDRKREAVRTAGQM
jgi:hypothetical protein